MRGVDSQASISVRMGDPERVRDVRGVGRVGDEPPEEGMHVVEQLGTVVPLHRSASSPLCGRGRVLVRRPRVLLAVRVVIVCLPVARAQLVVDGVDRLGVRGAAERGADDGRSGWLMRPARATGGTRATCPGRGRRRGVRP